MARAANTVFAKLEFTPTLPGIAWALKRAQDRGETLGKYLKTIILALLKENPYVLVLHFKDYSRLLRHLEQEAKSLETSLEEYVRLLLADRDRELYGKGPNGQKHTPPSLWYVQGYAPAIGLQGQTATRTMPEDDLDLDAALQNVDAFMSVSM